MTDYGKGGIITATALPATGSLGLLLSNSAHPAIVWGLFVISFLSFVVLIASVSRFAINWYRLNK